MRIDLDTSVFGPHEWKFPESVWEVIDQVIARARLTRGVDDPPSR